MRPRALVSASRGIGDIIRVTPLVRVCAGLGYDVDLLIAPDYPQVARLFEGAPGIRRLVIADGARIAPALGEHYDVATFTFWSRSLAHQVRTARAFTFEQGSWLRDGDSTCVRAIARQLGWSGPLPPPFAMPSRRAFDVEPGTVALHPGCKPDWPWKRWHGFEELARELPHVVVVGSPSDRDNSRTYFGRPFTWPAHVRDFTGALDLADTAALIASCAALVANDSGLMHLGVALGVPTFGVFGITSPEREAMEAPNMHVVTKGLPCEAACRRGAWGRRDCEHHLQCLRTLTGEEVARLVRARVATIVGEPAWTM